MLASSVDIIGDLALAAKLACGDAAGETRCWLGWPPQVFERPHPLCRAHIFRNWFSLNISASDLGHTSSRRNRVAASPRSTKEQALILSAKGGVTCGSVLSSL